MRFAKFTLFIYLFSIIAWTPAMAQGKGKGKRGKVSVPGKKVRVKLGSVPAPAPIHVRVGHSEKKPWAGIKVAFSNDQRAVIRKLVLNWDSARHPGSKRQGLPPGLAKKVARGGKLPPGWQKKCVVGQIMPPDIFVHCHPLPVEIAVKLPPPPPGTMVVVVSGKLVRVGKALHEILDVFDVAP